MAPELHLALRHLHRACTAPAPRLRLACALLSSVGFTVRWGAGPTGPALFGDIVVLAFTKSPAGLLSRLM